VPRVFSRGSPFTRDKLIEFFTHLSETEANLYVEHVRFRFCPSPGLEEQFLEDLLDFLQKLSKSIGDFTFHMRLHSDQPHLERDSAEIGLEASAIINFTKDRINSIVTENGEGVV